MQYNFIAIEGNIGAGKTSLAKKLANDFNSKLILEEFEDNPFLPKFYHDPGRYAFPLELFFLAERFQQLGDALGNPDLFQPGIVSDYFIHKSLIFGRNNLSDDEFNLFQRLFVQMHITLPKPDLLLYLYRDVNQLKNNIVKRGRAYEQNITLDYLKKIQAQYLNYLANSSELRVVILNCGDADFVCGRSDYEKIVRVVNRSFKKGLTHLDFASI